jgi:hypothetical protein
MEEKLQEIIRLYFSGYRVAEAIEVVKNEVIQASRGGTRTDQRLQ